MSSLMNRDEWERIVCTEEEGLYESNYLKANSPDGRWGLWIKHNLLRPTNGIGIAEFWVIISRPDGPPFVAKREVPWTELRTSSDHISIASASIKLSADHASGSIADMRWNLRLSGGDPALLHFPWDWMYRAPFPKKKAITPAPHLRFDGELEVAGQHISVVGWEGLRGHNWGKEHAWTYAYGNCHLWEDGERRTVDGFSARIRLPGGLKSPWLSTAVARNPDCQLNMPSHWLDGVQLTPTSWALRGRGYALEMSAEEHHMVGLRYAHPDGAESYCYNTKFASVSWQLGPSVFHSRKGEFESLFPTPVPNIPLHPPKDWEQTQGDYRS